MNTPTAPFSTIPSLEAGLTLLATSLVLSPHLRADGTQYRMLREGWPMHDDLQAIVRAAHNDEMPNDWRYGMVHDLCHAFLDYSQPQDQVFTADDYRDRVGEIAETRVETGTYALLTWLASNLNRCHFDEPEVYCADADGSSIADLAMRRQREEIEWMAHTILTGLEALVAA